MQTYAYIHSWIFTMISYILNKTNCDPSPAFFLNVLVTFIISSSRYVCWVPAEHLDSPKTGEPQSREGSQERRTLHGFVWDLWIFQWIWYLEAGYLLCLKKSMEKRSQSLWRKQIKPDTQLKKLLSSSWTESSSWDGFSKFLDMSENRTSSMISTA